MKIKSEKELNIIRGKMLVNMANTAELHDFLNYVVALESLLEDANNDDYFGTEGWQHKIGLN